MLNARSGEAAGPQNGPLVILLHGFPEFWYGWRAQIGPLAEAGFRVTVPDQRGYNQSSKPKDWRAYEVPRPSRKRSRREAVVPFMSRAGNDSCTEDPGRAELSGAARPCRQGCNELADSRGRSHRWL
jgi:hypothetical protein